MGSYFSSQSDIHEDNIRVIMKNDIHLEIEKWNIRREDVLKNLDGLTELYMSMDTRKERIKLIEENIEVFKDFFILQTVYGDIFQQIEYMFQDGLERYVKPKK